MSVRLGAAIEIDDSCLDSTTHQPLMLGVQLALTGDAFAWPSSPAPVLRTASTGSHAKSRLRSGDGNGFPFMYGNYVKILIFCTLLFFQLFGCFAYFKTFIYLLMNR